MKLLIYVTSKPRYNIKPSPAIGDGISAPTIVFFHPKSANNTTLTNWILIGEYIGGNNAVNPNLIPVCPCKEKYNLPQKDVFVETITTDETDEKGDHCISLKEAFEKVNDTLGGEGTFKKETIITFLLAFNAAGYNSLSDAEIIYDCLSTIQQVTLTDEFRDSIITDMMLRGVSYEFLWASLGANLK